MGATRFKPRAFRPTWIEVSAYASAEAAGYFVVLLPGPLRVTAANVIVQVAIDALLILGLLRGMRLAWWLAFARQAAPLVGESFVFGEGHVTADRIGLVVSSVIGAAVLLRIWRPHLGALARIVRVRKSVEP